ncbi:PH domain-containing protein [Olsenella profusa]|uniref:PH domain-containing protein n=1 Tax=Olsenella profusa TaxID=138595 RepID=A0ABS2F1B8_9ACTN|nr:PH domain-containing protein [Olsenella profusa]
MALVVDALRSYRAARYGNTARYLVLVSGGLTREGVIVPRGCIQHLQASASPFQRRAHLATVSARTAASATDGLSLRDLPADAADELLAWLRPHR